MPKVITAAGKEYLVRYPVGALIRAEAHLGKPLADLNQTSMSFSDMAIITRYGLHTLEGKPISQEEYDTLIDSLSLEEFSAVFIEVTAEFAGTQTEDTGKN